MSHTTPTPSEGGSEDETDEWMFVDATLQVLQSAGKVVRSPSDDSSSLGAASDVNVHLPIRKDPQIAAAIEIPAERICKTAIHSNSLEPGSDTLGATPPSPGSSETALSAVLLDGEELLRFIRGGYEALAAELVESGADPNAKDTYGLALTQAIRARDETLAGWLIEKGADPNAKDTYGPALTQAIRAGYEALAAKLIESGAKSNAKDASVSTLRTSQDRSLVDLAETLFPAQFVTYGGSSTMVPGISFVSGEPEQGYSAVFFG